MSFKDLSKERQELYMMTNKRLGLSAEECTHEQIDHPEGKTIVYSSDPKESDVPPKLITVNSIEEMKKLVATTLPDKDVKEPNESLALEKPGTVNEVERVGAIFDAAKGFVYGNSEKLNKYSKTINETFFPTKVALFASTDTKVIDGNAVIKSRNGEVVHWHYPEVVMGPNAKIIQESDFILETDELVSKIGPDGNLVINNTPPPYDKAAPDGSTPGTAGTAGPGTPGTSASNDKKKGCPVECTKAPGNGIDGDDGENGGPGSPGSKGRPMSSLTVTITKKLTGKIIIKAAGGDGQNGGNGGKGGDGQKGGPPGSCPEGCTPANKGADGKGGKGGMGGNGGDGGDVGQIIIKIPHDMKQPDVDIQPDPKGGKPGSNGNPGTGGANGGAGGETNTHKPKPSPAPQVTFVRLPPE